MDKQFVETIAIQNSGSLTTDGTTPSKQISDEDSKSFKYNESGRKYYEDEDVAYLLPNDDDETHRLYKQHMVLRYVLQHNYFAPVTEILNEGVIVLDSGCGPAAWTVDMGESFPHSKFYGIDISNVFPPEAKKPANVELVVGNIANCIPYPDNTFDFIHQRLLIVALTNEDWKKALKELYRVLKPGGYIELAEISVHDFVNKGPLLTKLQTMTMESFSKNGIPTSITYELKDRLVKAGFVNEHLTVTPLPVNHDGKSGDLFWGILRHVYMNLRPALTENFPEWKDPKVYEAYIEEIGVESKEFKTCINWYDCYAQKPFK